MMTLEYLHPQQAESMYLHHPSATGNFQQQGNHHHAGVPHPLPPPGQAPSAHHHQFETAEYWRQLQGVGAGGAEVGISPSTAAASSAAVAAAAAAAAATTTAAHHPHHHHQPNAGSVWAGGLPVSAAAVGGSSSTSTTPAEWQQYIHHASQNSATVACPQAATSVYGTEEFPGVHGQGQAYVGPGGIQTVAQALHRPMMTYDWMKSSTYRYNPQTGKTRTKDKYRVVYTDHQRLELEKEFHYSRYITIRRKSELAIALGLSERQVKIWFQNRRAKERKLAKKIKMQENKTSPTQQQQQQQQQQQRHSQPVIKQAAEEAESGPRQKDYNHNNNNTTHHNHQQQQQQQQQHQQQHNQHHHAMQQHSITPQHHHQQQQLRQHHLQVTDLSDTKPKMPIIISTMKPSSITTTTSTTSPPALDDERRHDVLAEDVSGSSHALVTVPTIISSSQQIPITAADVVGILGSKATVLQA